MSAGSRVRIAAVAAAMLAPNTQIVHGQRRTLILRGAD